MSKNDRELEATVEQTTPKEKKESVFVKVKRGVGDAVTDTKLFVKRNGKKIARGVAFVAGAVGAAVVIDKLNIDPSKIFRKNQDSPEVEEFDEPDLDESAPVEDAE